MSKEKEIEQMADLIGHNKHIRTSEQVACILYDEGYRRADEVRKETAREIFQMLVGHTLVDEDEEEGFGSWTWTISADDVRFIAEKYGVEVDE